MDQSECRLFDVPAKAGAPRRVPDAVAARLDRAPTVHRHTLLTEMSEMSARDGHWFDGKTDKLGRRAEDRRPRSVLTSAEPTRPGPLLMRQAEAWSVRREAWTE
jgi:hypothetical protein